MPKKDELLYMLIIPINLGYFIFYKYLYYINNNDSR